MSRKYDLVIFGATGFTGKIICSYINGHADAQNLNWAIAGRSEKKLQSLLTKLSLRNKQIDTLVVDSFDEQSIDTMCKGAVAVLSTVGPYNIYGNYLVESCVKHGTHYLDLTGEPQFVKRVREKFSQGAIDSGSIVLNCCGFESIPADVGSYLAIKTLDDKNLQVENYLLTRGKISGGTWASFLNSVSQGSQVSQTNDRSNKRHKKSKKIFFSKRFNKWALIFPVVDREIVRKSGRFFDYGSDFSFKQFLLFKSFLSMAMIVLGVAAISILSKLDFIRNWLRSYIPSGSGPSESERQKHWFRSIFVARSKTSEVELEISGGDPGYEETAKFISESALCIIKDRNNLLNDKGVLAPMECMGDLLINRLKNSGIKITIID